MNAFWKAKDAQFSWLSDGVADVAVHENKDHMRRKGKRQKRAKWVVLECMLQSNNIAMLMVALRTPQISRC